MMADQRAREDSFRPPVQDLNNEADLAAELAKLLKQNPDLKAQVSENLRHRHLQLVINEAGPPAPPWGSKLQTITSALQAVARFVFVFLMTALQTFTDVIKMEEEILKELRDKFDGMKRNLEGVEMKLKKVEQVVGNLKETVRLLVVVAIYCHCCCRCCCCRSEPEFSSNYTCSYLFIAYLFSKEIALLLSKVYSFRDINSTHQPA